MAVRLEVVEENGVIITGEPSVTLVAEVGTELVVADTPIVLTVNPGMVGPKGDPGTGGGGASAHGDLTGLAAPADDHPQYQYVHATYTEDDPFTITDESAVVTQGAAITLPSATAWANRSVMIVAAVVDLTVSCDGDDQIATSGGFAPTLLIPSQNIYQLTATDFGGTWAWLQTGRFGPAFDMPYWYDEGIAEGHVIRMGASAPEWGATPTGPAGADGKTVRNGSGAPSSGLGVDGDFYIDTTASTIYGPKTSGAWGSPTSLVGPTGSTGATGATGPTGVVTATSPLAYNSGTQTVSISVGTTSGTVAAGDDSRIIGAAQKASNLSDLASASTARTNLGLAAIAASGSGSDITSGTVGTARLGSGTANSTTFLRGDGTWATPSGGGSTNASDLTSGTLANARLEREVRAAARVTARSMFI